MGKIDFGGNNEIIQPVKKTGISEGVKDYKNIMEQTKKKVEILKFLDELEISEDKQDKYLKEILKYNIFDKVQEAFDENDLIKIIKKEEVSKKEKEVKKEKEKVELFKNIKKEKIYKLNSLKNSIKEENQEVKEENQEVKEENQEVKEENQEVKEENQEINNYKKIITFLSNSKQLDGNNFKYGNILKNLIHKYKENKNNFEITDIKEELEKLSQPDIFVAFANDLGGPNSTEYKQFKSLVKNTSSWNDFEGLFRDYESLDGTTISADKVIEGVERNSGGLVDVELGERSPVSRLRLLGSDYGFDKEIDKKALSEITDDSKEELNEIKEFGFDVLKDFKQNFAKETFDFGKLQDMYDYFEIRESDQIQLNDLEDFRNAETKEEKRQIFEEKIKPKIIKIEKIIKEKQSGILKQYEEEIKEIVLREKIRKKEQLETLKFLHQTGFDLIPQQITDQLINEYRHNVYDIPGLDLNPERLDLANGMFGEEPTEEGGTKWKQNLVKFLNKLIYGETNPKNSPLNPDAFISPMGAAINPTELQAIFEQQGIKSGSMWNINKMRDNLKSQEQKEK